MPKRKTCPKCGQLGEHQIRELPRGKWNEFIHKTEPLVIPGLGKGRRILEMCYVGEYCPWPNKQRKGRQLELKSTISEA